MIFIGERIGPLASAWQMPQGGIDGGENPAAAAWRELYEEVGTRCASLRTESAWWYAYDLPQGLRPPRWDPRFGGQTQRWFLFDFEGADDDIRLDLHEPEFVRWRWASPDEVLALIVDFKRPVYQAVLAEFAPLLAVA
jgi:putative (di)nucleoside polyphosphate hydrolase